MATVWVANVSRLNTRQEVNFVFGERSRPSLVANWRTIQWMWVAVSSGYSAHLCSVAGIKEQRRCKAPPPPPNITTWRAHEQKICCILIKFIFSGTKASPQPNHHFRLFRYPSLTTPRHSSHIHFEYQRNS
jgi:hypothetical protein